MSQFASQSDRRLNSTRTHSPRERSPLESWKAYRQQIRAQPSSQHFIRPLESTKQLLSSLSHRSQSPILKLKGEFEGFYQKATGSRPASPKAFVNNATFEPLILRTKAETKVAAEKAHCRSSPVSRLPLTLRVEDVSRAANLIQGSSDMECAQLSQLYVAELQRLSQAISEKFQK